MMNPRGLGGDIKKARAGSVDHVPEFGAGHLASRSGHRIGAGSLSNTEGHIPFQPRWIPQARLFVFSSWEVDGGSHASRALHESDFVFNAHQCSEIDDKVKSK